MESQIVEELRKIANRHRGLLRPRNVVEYARSNPDSALHDSLNWDDDEAAELWRVHQARNIIRRYSVVLTEQSDTPVRMYVSLLDDRTNDRGYRSIESVMTSADMRAQLLEQAFRDFEIFRLKYKSLSELAGVFAAIDEAMAASLPAKAGV